MYILDIIPLIKIPKENAQILSYFSQIKLKKGALVRIKVRNSEVFGLVVESHKLKDAKLLIKKSNYQIKSINAIVLKTPIFSDNYFQQFKWFVEKYPYSLGLIAKLFIPPYLLQKRKKEIEIPKKEKNYEIKQRKAKTFFVFKEKKKRKEEYEKIIKKYIKDQKQILFLVPDIVSLKYWEETLSHLNPTILTSKISKKNHFNLFCAIKKGDPIFLISTKIGLFLDFANLGLIILDEESDYAYRSEDMMPYYHAKEVAKNLSKIYNSDIAYGGTIPSIETYQIATKKEQKEILKNIPKINPPLVIDMKNEIFGKNYSIFAYYLQKKIEQKNKFIFFISKRGYETFVFCRDCGFIEKCPQCEVSLIHHKVPKSLLLCHICGFTKELPLICNKCKSTKIKYFGSGTEKVKEELQKFNKNLKAEIIDSNLVKNPEKQIEVFQKYNQNKIDVLIGTQMLFKTFELTTPKIGAILFFDNLMYYPDYSSNEKILKIIVKMQELLGKNKKLIIQTYYPENEMIQMLSNFDYKKYYQDELENRKRFFLPPFFEIIKIVYKNKNLQKAKQKITQLFEKLDKKYKEYIKISNPMPSKIIKKQGFYHYQIILKINNKEKRKEILSSIPDEFIIYINPEEIL